MTHSCNFEISQELKTLARLFFEAGFPLYAVGGMVRNPILGYAVSDTDITSAMRPEDVLELAKENNIRVVPKGLRFGMVELHMGDEKFEHTTFRSDVYGEGGAHRPESVRFSDSIDEDARRRDFTVNALYLDIASGRIVDPTGGLLDIEKRLIRATSADPSVILRDDALRIMRMARFAGELDFSVDRPTLEAAKENSLGLCDISGERLRAELDKILLCDVRYGAGKNSLQNALMLLRDSGAVDAVLPELARGRGIVQRPDYHAYDVLDHCLHSAAEAKPPRLTLRLASLLHDVGKPKVHHETGRMLYHDRDGVPIAREILTRLRYDNKTAEDVLFLIRRHMLDLNGMTKDSTLRERFASFGYDASLDLSYIREADVHGSGIITGEVKTAVRWRKLLSKMVDEGAPFSENDVNCTGRDIMEWTGLAAGERIGEIKRTLFMHCARKPADNTKEKLKRITKDIAR